MVSYNNSDVVQCLRQYDMFANSLKLIRNNEEKIMIAKQLTKLENKILELTNEVYEEEYNALLNKECGLLDEEKNRVSMLIELINQRLSYVEKRCNNHYILTGESIDAPAVEGAQLLDQLEDRVKIIDKYSKNVKLAAELEEDVKSLSNKIALASEKIEINKSLNNELETTFKNVVSNAIDKLNLLSLNEQKDDIEYAYYETEKSLRLAQANYESAKTSPLNILTDCENMLKDIRADYDKYRGQISILKLIDVYQRDVNSYEELLDKRNEIDDIVKYIDNQPLLDMIGETVKKQYNTILMEQQDINTFNDLALEKERKLEALDDIDKENNSEKFQSVLRVLIENEKKRQEKILEEQKRIEELEKKKRLEIERKRQEEILKRQKIIEEARKKEIEKRTKQLLEEQQNSILQTKKKDKEQAVSFETIKDISNDVPAPEVAPVPVQESVVEPEPEVKSVEEASLFDQINFDTNKQDDDLIDITPERKSMLEDELFSEFNKEKVEEEPTPVLPSREEKNSFFGDFELPKEPASDNANKFPDMSIDEYMKQFNENDVDKRDNLFDDDVFPSIPV